MMMMVVVVVMMMMMMQSWKLGMLVPALMSSDNLNVNESGSVGGSARVGVSVETMPLTWIRVTPL